MIPLFLAFAVAAEPAPTDPIVAQVEARYRGVDTLRARFVQTTRSEVYGDEKQTGTLVVARPDKIRWTFDDSGKVFVSDGTALWAYVPADKQVVKYPAPSKMGASADVLLQSLDQLSQRFTVTVASSDATGHVLSLAPKAQGGEALFKKLELSVDPKLVVKGIQVTDAFGTVTDLALSNVEVGATVPPETFRFEVPPGVEVLDAGS